jgi:pimeloyl-ACP methyl ester carboxylesterase
MTPVTTTPPSADGIEIWYTTDGDPSAEPLLLVMGLGAQYLVWPDDLVQGLVDRGYFVIRYDNRDVGLSTKPDVGDLQPMAEIMAALGGGTARAPYLLSDMAGDGIAVLDALGIGSAHVVGASMGGMIAQTIAIEHPDRVRSLTSIMSTTGARDVGQPDPSVMGVLLAPAPTTREEAVARGVEASVAIGSPGLVDEAEAADRVGRAYDRCDYPQGTAHQLLAIIASPDRTEALGGVTVPTLVIHGDEDPLVTPSGGDATAAAIPGARLLVIEGMGHDHAPQHLPVVIDAIAANAAAATTPA